MVKPELRRNSIQILVLECKIILYYFTNSNTNKMSSVGKFKKVKLKKKYFWICPSTQIIHALLFGTGQLTGAVSCYCVSLHEAKRCLLYYSPWPWFSHRLLMLRH